MSGGHSGKEMMFDVEEHVVRHEVFQSIAKRPRDDVRSIAVVMDRPNREECGQALADRHRRYMIRQARDSTPDEGRHHHNDGGRQFGQHPPHRAPAAVS